MTHADGRTEAGMWRDGILETALEEDETTGAAVREAGRSARSAGRSVRQLHADLEGVPGPLTATHLITWGGTVADHPWEETEPDGTDEEIEEETPGGVGGGGDEAGGGQPEGAGGVEGEAGMASRIVLAKLSYTTL